MVKLMHKQFNIKTINHGNVSIAHGSAMARRKAMVMPRRATNISRGRFQRPHILPYDMNRWRNGFMNAKKLKPMASSPSGLLHENWQEPAG
jgi:hypothetical protein